MQAKYVRRLSADAVCDGAIILPTRDGRVADSGGGDISTSSCYRGSPQEPKRAGFSSSARAALDEADARTLLTSYGIPFADWRRVKNEAEARVAAHELGFPLVLKAIEPEVGHKTEAGLVRTDIRTECELSRALTSLTIARGGRDGPFIVERMISGQRELSAGMFRDPQFGPVIMLGLGGVLAEALGDVVFALAPLDPDEAAELADHLGSRAILAEFRGMAAVDRTALVQVTLALSRLALEHPQVAEVDINPLILPDRPSTPGHEGTHKPNIVHPVAVDALVVVDEPTEEVSSSEATALPIHLTPDHWRTLFSPRSVLVVGASSNPAKWGGSLLVNLMRAGFPGTIYPVNPRAGSLFGLTAYPSIAAVPGKVDLALAAVPAAQLPSVIERCAAKGAKALVAVTAGFAEHSPEGAELERRVAETATAREVLLLGPNTVGVLSTHSRLIGLGAAALDIERGSIGLMSQSGNVAIALMLLAHEARLGIGKFVGLGNEALVTSAEVLDYFAGDPDTTLVLGYIEGIKRGPAFLRAAKQTTARKPVVLLRGGTSDAGGRAAASHTGALAGSDRVFACAARQCGLIVATDQDEFIDTALALSSTPLPTGRRVAVVASGGGWGVICVDELVRQGLEPADLPPGLVTELEGVLPTLWSRRNPLDLVATIEQAAVAFTIERLLDSDAIDAIIMLGVLSMPFMLARVCAEAGEEGGETYRRLKTEEQGLADMPGPLMKRYGKPVLAVEFSGTARPVAKLSGDPVLPVFPSPLRACRALAHMAKYAEYRRRLAHN